MENVWAAVMNALADWSQSDSWPTLWENTLLNAGHRLWRKQERPDRRPTVMVCFRVCVWWTLTTGGLVFIILPVSTLMAGSPSPLRSSRLILILAACVTCRTHVCFPFIYETFLSHTLADCLLVETAFYHAIVRWKYYLRYADYFEFPGEERYKQCTLQMCWLRWIYCYSGILEVWSEKYSVFLKCAVMAERRWFDKEKSIKWNAFHDF